MQACPCRRGEQAVGVAVAGFLRVGLGFGQDAVAFFGATQAVHILAFGFGGQRITGRFFGLNLRPLGLA